MPKGKMQKKGKRKGEAPRPAKKDRERGEAGGHTHKKKMKRGLGWGEWSRAN